MEKLTVLTLVLIHLLLLTNVFFVCSGCHLVPKLNAYSHPLSGLLTVSTTQSLVHSQDGSSNLDFAILLALRPLTNILNIYCIILLPDLSLQLDLSVSNKFFASYVLEPNNLLSFSNISTVSPLAWIGLTLLAGLIITLKDI
jgi:hypothetical protein